MPEEGRGKLGQYAVLPHPRDRGCDVIASLPGGFLEEAEEFGEAAVEG